MTEDTAKRSVDWLHSTGCRVLAYMGGEPLLHPDFIHRITYYAAKKNFWIYPPTNARLLRTDVIDKLADADMSTFNIAVDAVDIKPGPPKALKPIRKQFDCRAGQNSMIIRVDGTLAPCFPMYTAKYGWGTVGNHKFDTNQLDHQKETCQTHYFSTLNHILGWCYNDQRVIKYFFSS